MMRFDVMYDVWRLCDVVSWRHITYDHDLRRLCRDQTSYRVTSNCDVCVRRRMATSYGDVYMTSMFFFPSLSLLISKLSLVLVLCFRQFCVLFGNLCIVALSMVNKDYYFYFYWSLGVIILIFPFCLLCFCRLCTYAVCSDAINVFIHSFIHSYVCSRQYCETSWSRCEMW